MALLRYVSDADRARLSKEDAENAVIAGEVADPSSSRVVDPGRKETFQVRPRPIEDPERRVARKHKPCCHFHSFLEHVIERSLRADRNVRFDEALKALRTISNSMHGYEPARDVPLMSPTRLTGSVARVCSAPTLIAAVWRRNALTVTYRSRQAVR
jgi:hypothetical protein